MLISDFCRVATTEHWTLKAVKCSVGWSVSFKAEQIETQRGSVRCWASLNVLEKHIRQAGFIGQMIVVFSSQSELKL